MKKKVLVISTSLRQQSNSDALAEAFMRGAEEAGHEVEKISMRGKDIRFCRGCLSCQNTGKCVIKDDMLSIIQDMHDADVIVFATPVYYFEMCGQMKTLLDRANPLYGSDYRFRNIYLFTAAAEDEEEVPQRAVNGLEGWIACNWEFMDNVGVNIPSFAEWKKNGRTDARLGNATIDHVWHINMQQYGFERTVQGIYADGYDIARLKHGRYCDIIASSVNTDRSKWNTCYTAGQYYNATYGRVVGRAGYNAYANGGLVYANAGDASSDSYSNSGARLAYCGKFANEKEICDEAV